MPVYPNTCTRDLWSYLVFLSISRKLFRAGKMYLRSMISALLWLVASCSRKYTKRRFRKKCLTGKACQWRCPKAVIPHFCPRSLLMIVVQHEINQFGKIFAANSKRLEDKASGFGYYGFAPHGPEGAMQLLLWSSWLLIHQLTMRSALSLTSASSSPMDSSRFRRLSEIRKSCD